MITDALSEDVHELINHGANDFVLRDTPAAYRRLLSRPCDIATRKKKDWRLSKTEP